MKNCLTYTFFASIFLQSCALNDNNSIVPLSIRKAANDLNTGFLTSMRIKNADQYPYEYVVLLGQAVMAGCVNPSDIHLKDTTTINQCLSEHPEFKHQIKLNPYINQSTNNK